MTKLERIIRQVSDLRDFYLKIKTEERKKDLAKAPGRRSTVTPDRTIRTFQRTIIADAEAKLGRPLSDRERAFITSRGGFVALEMIHDTVRTLQKEELEAYLGS